MKVSPHDVSLRLQDAGLAPKLRRHLAELKKLEVLTAGVGSLRGAP